MKLMIKRLSSLLLSLLLLVAPLSGCANEMERCVAVCNGYDVLYEELRFVVMTQKGEFAERYGTDVFSTPENIEKYRSEFEAAVTERLKENYAVLAACAHYLPDLELDDDAIETAVDQMMESTIAQMGGQSIFDEYADMNFTTEHFMRFTLAVYEMEKMLLRELAARGEFFSEAQMTEFSEWLNNGNCVYVQHLFIRNDAGESVESNRATAQEARQKLLSGEAGINTLVGNATYNQDPTNTTPYYLVKDVYDKALENAALALTDEGSISEIVETDEGFYIFVRMKDEQNTLESKLSELLSSYQWAHTERIKETFRASLDFEWKEEIDFLSIT